MGAVTCCYAMRTVHAVQSGPGAFVPIISALVGQLPQPGGGTPGGSGAAAGTSGSGVVGCLHRQADWQTRQAAADMLRATALLLGPLMEVEGVWAPGDLRGVTTRAVRGLESCKFDKVRGGVGVCRCVGGWVCCCVGVCGAAIDGENGWSWRGFAWWQRPLRWEGALRYGHVVRRVGGCQGRTRAGVEAGIRPCMPACWSCRQTWLSAVSRSASTGVCAGARGARRGPGGAGGAGGPTGLWQRRRQRGGLAAAHRRQATGAG